MLALALGIEPVLALEVELSFALRIANWRSLISTFFLLAIVAHDIAFYKMINIHPNKPKNILVTEKSKLFNSSYYILTYIIIYVYFSNSVVYCFFYY